MSTTRLPAYKMVHERHGTLLLTYVLITGERSKETTFSPFLLTVTLFSGMLLIATRFSGISILKSNVALRFGSSKQGKALLASHGSKSVLNIRWLSPSIGTKSDGVAARVYLLRMNPTILLFMVPVKSISSMVWVEVGIPSGKLNVARCDFSS